MNSFFITCVVNIAGLVNESSYHFAEVAADTVSTADTSSAGTDTDTSLYWWLLLLVAVMLVEVVALIQVFRTPWPSGPDAESENEY